MTAFIAGVGSPNVTRLRVCSIGGKGAPFSPVDLETVVAQAKQNLEIAIEEKGAAITADPLPTVLGDAGQLTQLFQNLIGNAIRYRSDAPPRIHVAAERSGEGWLFSVQDNGIGIDPQYKEQIFGIFKRLHNATKYLGTGMGLAICRRIVERSGGRIWAESEPGRGSSFFFTLPVSSEE